MHLNFVYKYLTFIPAILLITSFEMKAQETNGTRGAIVTSKSPADTLKGDTYAIITGISSYPDINPLKYADRDALLFRDFLITPAGGNTKRENILSLINDSAKAADFNVRAYSWLLNKKLKKGDRLYLYFSGHGDAMSEDLYFFLPYDCAPNKDDHNYLGTGNINMHTVKTLFIKPQAAKGVDVILIMDACRTNELGGEEGQKNFTNSIAEQKMGEIMLLSTGAGQVSVESSKIGNGHGLFTYYLIDGLAGTADKDSLNGGDVDGKVSLSEIGTYVKTIVKRIARVDYNTIQIPYFCCPEKELATISKVDASTYTAWENSKRLLRMGTNENLFAVNDAKPGTRSIGGLSNFDSLQNSLYNKFIEALKKEELTALDSADFLYKELQTKWPGSEITEDAKYSLVTKYLNFCQQKINLFIEGKGLIHILSLEMDVNKAGEKPGNNNEAEKKPDNNYENETAGTFGSVEEKDQIRRLKTLVNTGFDVACKMMERSFELLKERPELLQPYRPKLDFLKTMAAYSNKKNNLEDVRNLCRKALLSDPNSAAAYQLMGWIYQEMQNDSSEYFFRKASLIAPKWPYPVNGLGTFYVSKNRKNEAIPYFQKAISMDSLYVDAYRNSGITYINLKKYRDAKLILQKAYSIDSCDSYVNQYLGIANETYIGQYGIDRYTDSINTNYFKIARRYYSRSINCDPTFASAYQKLSSLYSKIKNEDSALAVLERCTVINPENSISYRNLGTYYLTIINDSLKAANNFTKAIYLDPTVIDNYFSLARLYRKQKNRTKAIEVYSEALENIGAHKDLLNEMGNTYFEAPSQFGMAIRYYKKALETDSTLAYVCFNLGKLYGIKDSSSKENIAYFSEDSSIHYYRKAVRYDPERFQKVNATIAQYFLNHKEFELASAYYHQSFNNESNRQMDLDLEYLIKSMIEEKQFSEAASTLNKYHLSDSNQALYSKLMRSLFKSFWKDQFALIIHSAQ